MTTTALVPYTEPDSGFGIRRSSTGALVSVPWGRHCRGLSVTGQRILCAVFNAVRLVMLAVGSLVRYIVRDPRPRVSAAFGAVRWLYRNRRWLLVRRNTRRALAFAWAAYAPLVVLAMVTLGPLFTFYAGLTLLVPLAWRLSVELAETREVGA